MTNKKFIESLKLVPSFHGDKERQVEQIYNEMLKTQFPSITISNPEKCDGYFQLLTKNGKSGDVIIEYKYDEDLASAVGKAKVLTQVLFYLKKIDSKSDFPLPHVILIGDVNECLVLHVNPLLKYLDFPDVDWKIAPSNAWTKNSELVLAISRDSDLNTWVYDIKEGFDFTEIANKIEDAINNIVRYEHITEHNIDRIFGEFTGKVLKKNKNLSANDIVGVFMGCIVDSGNNYLHPKKKNVLVTSGYGEVAIDGGCYESFFGRYEQKIPPFEKKRLIEICDRLIEDNTRRKQGAFFTPTNFVDYAHKRIEQVLGENWRDEYVVWDCCCGTGNLTRDYVFKELYRSTLEESEVELANKYNRNNEPAFKFDFLNDEIDVDAQEGKLPCGLMEALKGGKKIVFFMNPPYGTGCNWNETSKEGINSTKVRELMHKEGQGAGAENLQHQFMFNICKLAERFNLPNVVVALFSNPIYLTGGKQKEFLKFYCNRFEFKDGVMFCANHFSDTSDAWGITFNVWCQGKTEDIHNFRHDLVDTDENGEIVKVGEKDLYNVWDSDIMSNWVKKEIKGMKTSDYVQLSSAVKVKDKGRGSWIDGGLGYYTSVANNVCSNGTNTFILSSCASIAHGSTILPINFTKVCCSFTARKLVENTWINHFDEYLAPDTSNPNFHQFEVDSVVYSLFNSKSQQSSLRQIDYKNKKWDIPNHWFWMSKSEIMNLANEHNLDDTYNDASSSNERFVYLWLKDNYSELSEDAKSVLDKASDLVRKSFKYRELFHMEHPEFQVLNWCIGFYQIKAILKQYMPNELKEFREMYKKFSERLLPKVYELGFLRK